MRLRRKGEVTFASPHDGIVFCHEKERGEREVTYFFSIAIDFSLLRTEERRDRGRKHTSVSTKRGRARERERERGERGILNGKFI